MGKYIQKKGTTYSLIYARDFQKFESRRKCPRCEGLKGSLVSSKGKISKYQCENCRKIFYSESEKYLKQHH